MKSEYAKKIGGDIYTWLMLPIVLLIVLITEPLYLAIFKKQDYVVILQRNIEEIIWIYFRR